MSRTRILTLGVMLACLAFGAWGAARLEIHSELGQLTPGNEQSSELSSVLAESVLARTWAVLLRGDDKEPRMCVARRLHKSLLAGEQVQQDASVEEVDKAFYELYFPRRSYFLADEDDEREALLSREGLDERLKELRAKLASPTGAFARKLAPQDPLQIFVHHLESMQALSGARLTRDEDLLVTEEGAVALLLRTRFSAFDAEASRRFEETLHANLQSAKNTCGAENVTLSQSATHRFSWRTEQTIRADIQRVSVFSTLGMVLLFLIVLPSVRALLGVFVPTAIGLATAVGATALVFGRVHGMSVAFGAAMLGVCVDYAIHWVIHDFSTASESAEALVHERTVARSILLGAGTTIAGLALLAGASFPGMRELSFFACVGVAGAAAATLWLLPPWIKGKPVARTVALADRFAPIASVMRRPRVGWIVLLGAAVLALGLTRASWSYGLEALLDRDPSLVAEDAEVRREIARFSAGRLVAVQGDTVEDALQKLETVEPVLRGLRARGTIDVAQSVHPYLWSVALQNKNLRSIRNPKLAERLSAAAKANGFADGAFTWPDQTKLPPLQLSDLKASALAPMVEPFVVQAANKVWVFAFLGDVADIEEVAAALSQHDAIVFDQASFLARAFDAYRARVFSLGAAGLLVIFVVLLARYRNWFLAFAAFMPAAVACVATLGLLGWSGASINILHIVALLLVLGIGVDYGVFVVEPFLNPNRPSSGLSTDHRAVFLSIATACLTTTLSFGLLAVSDYAPLRSMGSALMVGVPLSLLLAPLSSWIAAKGTAASKGAA